MLSNAESRSLVRRFSTELSKGSKMSEMRFSTAEPTSTNWGDVDLIALKSAGRNESRYTIFGKCIASARYERTTCGGKRGAFVAAPGCSIKRNVLWNLKTTTLFEIPSSRTRSSSSNRNALSVAFRYGHAQLKSWSNSKNYTEPNAPGQTPLHERTRMRINV
jgi:hypothetical protein